MASLLWPHGRCDYCIQIALSLTVLFSNSSRYSSLRPAKKRIFKLPQFKWEFLIDLKNGLSYMQYADEEGELVAIKQWKED